MKEYNVKLFLHDYQAERLDNIAKLCKAKNNVDIKTDSLLFTIFMMCNDDINDCMDILEDTFSGQNEKTDPDNDE